MSLYTFVYNSIHMSTKTVRLESKVKNKLESFKNYEKESYSDVIGRLVNIAEEDDSLTKEEIRQIEKSLEDIKKGTVLPLKQAEKKWGI